MITIKESFKVWEIEVDGKLCAESDDKSEALKIALGIAQKLDTHVVLHNEESAEIVHRAGTSLRDKDDPASGTW